MTTGTWGYWAVLSAVFAALTAIFAKLGVEGVNADLATLIRTIVIVIVLLGFVPLTGQWANRALQLGDVSKVAPVDKLSVILIALFAFAFLGERPAARDWAGILLVGAGVLILLVRR